MREKNQIIIFCLLAVSILVGLFYTISCGRAVNTRTTTSSISTTIPGPFDFVLGTNTYALPSITMPAKGASITEPNFHTTITRFSDKNVDGYSGPGIENEYAKMDPENSDGTLLVLRGNDGEWYLYNANNFQMIKHLNILSGAQDAEPRWDPTNPKVFYTPYATELRSYNVDTDVFTAIHDFKNDIPNTEYITTKTEGDASLDRRLWCFIIVGASNTDLAVICYDKLNNIILGRKDAPFINDINWTGMDMSGSHCIIGYDSRATQVFSKDFSIVKDLPAGAVGHMDLAQTLDGKDVMVYQNNDTDYIAMADLDTGIETPLVKIPFYDTSTGTGNNDIGLHVSGNCSQTPGWVLISTYGSKDPPSGMNHSWMDNQLFMMELKANPRIWRIAHTHAYTSLDFIGTKNYFAECFAAINTKGTKIFFGSNWDDTATPDYSETYQIILPGNWNNRIP